jgi:hypothetical protein
LRLLIITKGNESSFLFDEGEEALSISSHMS